MTPVYDLILKGGRLIDPWNSVDMTGDLAIRDGRIAAVGADVDGEAAQTLDMAGLLITPGLIDIHVHVYGGYFGWLFPDQHSLPNGVTTVVDAGGAGYRTLQEFRETIVEPATTRVLALLNIVGAGMVGAPEQDTGDMDPGPCAAAVRQHPELLVGVKSAHFSGPGWESAGGGIAAARQSDTIVMIDFAPQPTRTYQELLERMGPGDMHTHMYAAHIPLLDADKKVSAEVRAARERGVLFDTGHGGGSFWFRIAAPALEQGFPPDTISTDLHKTSRMLPNALMPIVMSKFLALGMPLPEVIYRATQRPAEVIRRPELGHLSVGAGADVAVFALNEGNFGFVDTGRARLRGTQRLECQLTIRDGKIVWDLNGVSRPDWETAGEYHRLG